MNQKSESQSELPEKWPSLTLLAPPVGASNEAALHIESHYERLSPARKCLVDVLSELQFGRIEVLSIAGGEPRLNPSPTIIHTIRLPVEACVLPSARVDYVLKRHFQDLFQCFDRWQDVVIARLECRFGLPCLVEFVKNLEIDRSPDWSSK